LDQGRLRIYIYADRRSFVPMMMVEYDSIHSDSSSGKRFYLVSDQRGQITEVFDSAGTLVWQVVPEPYGEVRLMRGELDWFSMRMPGHYADQETQLYYNRHRYYDPKLARYVQSDPIGLAGGWNTYAYVDDPLTNVDLQGLHGKQASKGKSKRGANGPPGKSGSAKPSKISGMTDEAFESLAKTANKHNVRIRVRPSNPDCLPHIKNGHPKKPEFIKNKTINKTDSLMGPPPQPGNEGLVGHFKPPGKEQAIKNAEDKLGRKLTKEEAEKLESRRAQRLAEYNQNDKYLRDGAVSEHGNKVHVDEDRGVLVDNRPGPTQGKEFTGDHDLFDIEQKGPDGKWHPADPDTKNAVVDDLKNDPHFEAQHGDHQSWDYDPNDAQAKNIDKNIKEGHQPGGEPLIDVYPDGTTGTSHYDGPIPD
jgi:RHS repeat-associated protein